MTSVYTAASTLDAQLVVDLLEDAGIAARPAVPGPEGHVDVHVADEDADAARALVRHLESGTAELEDDDDGGVDLDAIALADDDDDPLLDSTPLAGD